MVTEQQFRAAFSEAGLCTFDPAVAATLGLPPEESDWLTTVGLPRWAAPCLDFGVDAERHLPTVGEFFGGAPGVPAGDRFRVIGTNGSGDPVAIDLAANGAIVYLNHDKRYERVFINSSVRQLATSLVAFAKMIAAAQQANGERAFIDRNVPPALVNDLRDEISRADAGALERGAMWATEIDALTPRASWLRRLFGAER
jgi:hypothetical protein